MRLTKEHKEFYSLNMEEGWKIPEGYPSGIEELILSGSLDEKNRRGFRTRCLRFQPGAFTTKPFVHDYWEEVYLVSGDLVVGCHEEGEAEGRAFGPNTYACRPPGTSHGPFRSESGCLLLEIHFYDSAL